MDDHAAILDDGVEAWNRWRNENPSITPELHGADLGGRDLRGANLNGADLRDADLDGTDLSDANLKMAMLDGADLAGVIMRNADLYKASLREVFAVAADLTSSYVSEAEIVRADLRGAKLNSANLVHADLSDSSLVGADLSGADLSNANVQGTDFTQARFSEANVQDLRYGSFASMSGRYFGIRGLESCYGNALFVRDAQDQDYLATLKHSIDRTPSPAARRAKQLAFRAWSLIDFGRSLAKPAMYALIVALSFGVVYSFDVGLGWGLMDYSGSADSVLSPFYYSIVTYTTLGFGDITPKNWIGEVVVVTEVILGYTTLGLLLSILANRVARQS